jgi:hypothetical protein
MYPPLQTSFGDLTVLNQHQVLLEQTVDGIATGSPALALIEDNAVRRGILDGEGIWRWRAQAYLNEGDFSSFDSFVGSLIQYMASTKRRQRLDVSSEAFYFNNNPIVISAQYFDNNYVFDPTAQLRILISPEGGGSGREFPMLLKNNYFEVDLSSLEAGDYTYTVSVKDQPVSASSKFSVLDYGIERQFLNANAGKMDRAAQNAGGAVFYPENLDDLITRLLDDDRLKAVQESQTKVVPLIDWFVLLAVLALLLALEWFVRKYNGLI